MTRPDPTPEEAVAANGRPLTWPTATLYATLGLIITAVVGSVLAIGVFASAAVHDSDSLTYTLIGILYCLACPVWGWVTERIMRLRGQQPPSYWNIVAAGYLVLIGGGAAAVFLSTGLTALAGESTAAAAILAVVFLAAELAACGRILISDLKESAAKLLALIGIGLSLLLLIAFLFFALALAPLLS